MTRHNRMLLTLALAIGFLVGAASLATSTRAPNRDQAVTDAFAKLKALEGNWRGTNSRNQPVTLSYKVVGGGTAVVETFDIDDQPDHTMVTVYHRDGNRLLLTHYCAAANQPRMQAAGLVGKEIQFEFLDATDLESADEGHMHRALLTFEDSDQLTSRWNWYENRQEAFTETVKVRRLP